MVSYRLAGESDNEQLLHLTRQVGMSGDTGLVIDRRPDFFALLKRRGESRTFIAEDGDKIIGAICVSISNVFVNGQQTTAAYVGDFKVAESYRRSGIGAELVNRLHDYLKSIDADLVVLTLASGNRKPLSFFKNRPGVPDFQSVGVFNVYQFPGQANGRQHSGKYRVESSPPTDELVEFLNKHYRRYELGPVITVETIESDSNYVISDGNRIIAAMTLSDVMAVKQNIITKLSPLLRIALSLADIAGRLLKWSRMPALLKPVDMLYIRFLALSRDDPAVVDAFIRKARSEAYRKAYSFVALGIHEKDHLNNHVRQKFKFTFRSMAMVTTLKRNHTLIQRITDGVPYEDYSLV